MDEVGAERVACVTFAIPAMLRLFERELDLGIRYYGDPSKALYDAFGFGRGSVQRVYLDPRVWLRYGRLLAGGGRIPRQTGQDTLQLGGDVVVDAAGVVRWLYRSTGPDDRPGAATVAAALRAAQA